MSLLGRKPIPLPAGVTVSIGPAVLTVTGPKGTLTVRAHPSIAVSVEGASLRVAVRPERAGERGASAQWGTQWALLRNAVAGVSAGFVRQLELHGVGYRADVTGGTLRLFVGFTHGVDLTPPAGIAVRVEKNIITVSGTDKQAVGAFAADIRRVRPPEPYKGKGIRYVGETVRRKVGKVVGTTTAG